VVESLVQEPASALILSFLYRSDFEMLWLLKIRTRYLFIRKRYLKSHICAPSSVVKIPVVVLHVKITKNWSLKENE